MVVPFLLFVCFAALAGFGLVQGNLDLIFLAAPACLAALLLLQRSLKSSAGRSPSYIVVDGSNVLYWRGDKPQLDVLNAVLGRLRSLGYAPGVVFDAQAGQRIAARYQNEFALAKALGLPADRVLVAEKDSPTDPLILESARDLGAKIVSNSQFTYWAESYPEVETPGHLVRGGYRNGKLWLDLDGQALG